MKHLLIAFFFFFCYFWPSLWSTNSPSFVQVVLCRHLGVWRLCRHLFCDIRLCGWHHTGAREEHSVRFGKDLCNKRELFKPLQTACVSHWRLFQYKITCSVSTSFFSSPAGIGYVCSQPGHQPRDRSLPVWGLWRHLGGDPRHSHRPPRHLLHPGGRAGVPAREDEASVVGSSHLLGAGRPFCCE